MSFSGGLAVIVKRILNRKQTVMLSAPFDSLWSEDEAFDKVQTLIGTEFRNVSGRRTFRIEVDNAGFFVKTHQGVGWREILKNLMTGKIPVIGAGAEFRASRHLKEVGIPALTITAFGAKGLSPAKTESFLITEEIAPAVDLEVVTKDWATVAPSFRFKLSLIGAVARLIRDMHEAGVNHRDCYLCHFLLHSGSREGTIKLSVIDLHRAQIRDLVSERWIIKDLAALAFSAQDIGLTKRDWLRFLMMYFECDASSLIYGRMVELERIRRRLKKFVRRKAKYGELL